MASGFLCAFGCAIRSISAKTNPPSYALAMVGQIIGGSSAPMALNVMTMVCIIVYEKKMFFFLLICDFFTLISLHLLGLQKIYAQQLACS